MRKIFVLLAVGLTMAGLWVPRSAGAANVNNFTIQNYQIDYYLSKDSNGRSVLKTTEVIAAVFPQIDQNHGIERAIPAQYDGHSTQLQINEVTDAAGKSWNYESRDENNNTVLRIGDAGRYVHGLQTYKITYTQHDVTKYFSNTNDDELYWDTNGTGWAVPIQELTARIHIQDKTLKTALTGKQSCYAGPAGSSEPCSITQSEDGFIASAGSLQPYENMTVAIGFKPHTFGAYQPGIWERLATIWFILLFITTPIGLALLIWFIIRYYRRSNRTAEMRPIIPEYLPPADTSVAASAAIARTPNRLFSAQLIDFAVRHYIKIYQTREKRWFRQAEYEIEIIKDISSLKAEEQELFRDIFDRPTVGKRLNLASLKNNAATARKLLDNPTKLSADITGKYGLRTRDAAQSAWFKKIATWVLFAAIITLSPALFVAAITAFICGSVLRPLTSKGLELARYMEGLKMYITVAEMARLRMLQSPEGATKLPAPVDTNDKRQLIKLYEKVLPYAILMGKEREWNKRLGQYYESVNGSPTWFQGNNAVFTAAAFSSAMNSLGTVATYSDPSSSSSGGSGGGGSSGGGGGGGGGGGW